MECKQSQCIASKDFLERLLKGSKADIPLGFSSSRISESQILKEIVNI